MAKKPGSFANLLQIAMGGGFSSAKSTQEPYNAYCMASGNSGEASYLPDAIWSNMEILRTGEWYFEVCHGNKTYNAAGIVSHYTQQNPNDLNSFYGVALDYKDDGFTIQQDREYHQHKQESPAGSSGAQWGSSGDLSDNDVMGFYINDGVIKIYHSGSVVHTFDSMDSIVTYLPMVANNIRATPAYGTAMRMNFGQDSTFQGRKTSGSANASDANGYGDFFHTPPGNALALCYANMTDRHTSSAFNYIDGKQCKDAFNCLTYEGTGSAGRAVTGMGHQPDLLLFKNVDAGNRWYFFDTSRGTTKAQAIDGRIKETLSGVTSFDSDGFTLGSSTIFNTNNETNFVASWKVNGGVTSTNTQGTITATVQANADYGISIMRWSGTASTGTIGHELGTAPGLILGKNLDRTFNWGAHFTDRGKNSQAVMYLNTNASQFNDGSYFNSGTDNITSTVIPIGNGNEINSDGEDCYAIAFAPVPGYCKIGRFEGSGQTDRQGSYVHCGFSPKMVWIKNINNTGEWIVQSTAEPFSGADDINEIKTNSKRGNTQDFKGTIELSQTTSVSSIVHTLRIDFMSTGFKIVTADTDVGGDDNDYYFIAWAEHPQQYANAFFKAP